MKWIGLTGGLGTGKSTVAKILRQLGHVVIDADSIAGQVIAPGSPGLRSVAQKFGPDFLLPTGQLDRARLGQEVFSRPRALADLENIIHPLVKVETQLQKEAAFKNGAKIAFYDVPLLFEKNISGFDAIVVVTTSEANQKIRVAQRNTWSEAEINNRLKSQLPLSLKIQKADHVIQNDGSLQALETAVKDLLKKLNP